MTAEPRTPIVPVFRTADEGLLPLATLALDEAGIEYTVRKAGLSEVFGVSHPTPGFESTGLAVEVLVLADDAERARELLAELEQGQPVAVPGLQAGEVQGAAAAEAPPVPVRVELVDGDTGQPAGALSGAQFEWLSSRLVLESPDDRDYWVDAATIEMLEAEGADAELLQTLRRALGTRDGVNLIWR